MLIMCFVKKLQELDHLDDLRDDKPCIARHDRRKINWARHASCAQLVPAA